MTGMDPRATTRLRSTPVSDSGAARKRHFCGHHAFEGPDWDCR